MTELDFAKLPFQEAYKILIGSVVPRPIAWVSTANASGQSNLAPFSFFNAVCSNPPTVLFCPVNHPDGREKDTFRNVRDTKDFVVNIASEALVEKMNQTSANYPADVSEFEKAGLTAAPSKLIKAPRVLEAPIQLECKLTQIVDIGLGGAGSGHIVIGQVVYAHFHDNVFRDGKILIEELKPVARLAGSSYCRVNNIFELPRPIL